MATLAFSVVGAGLGSVTGIGAAVGWQVGSVLGQVFFPEKSAGGSRLTDLKISGASYGASIPRVFGTMRLGGNVIWAAPLEAREGHTESGGKGGLSSSGGQAAYDYFASFALALATGEVGEILKIWADGAVIYDKTTAGETRLAGLNFRLYAGDEDQLPDSIMEATEGAGTVPAYRGLCYLVFDSFPLASYGNRIPNIEVLICQEGTSHYPQQIGADGSLIPSSVAYDPVRGHVYTYEVVGAVNKMRKIDLASLSILAEADIGIDFPELSYGTQGFSIDRQGDLWVGSGFGMLAGRKFSRFNTRGMIPDGISDLPSGVGAVGSSIDILSVSTGQSFQVAGSQQSAQIVVFDPSLDVVSVIDTASIACTGAARDETETAWIALSGLSGFSDLQIAEVTIIARQGLDGHGYSTQHEIHTVPQSDLTPLGGTPPEMNNVTRLVGYLKARKQLVFQNDYRLFTWSIHDKAVAAVRDISGISALSLVHTNNGEELVYVEAGRWLVYVSAGSLEEIARADLSAFGGSFGPAKFVYDASSDSICVLDQSKPLARFYLRRIHGKEASFQYMLEVLAGVSGLSVEDIDVSLISGSVPGYVLNRPMSVQQALSPLMLAGNFDVSESGYKLKFSPRKDISDETIDTADFLKPVSHRRLQESEMPGAITLTYMAADSGHLAGTQRAKRQYAPQASMFGRNETALDLPLSLTAIKAKDICQRSLYSAWSERHLVSASLPLKYLALDAGDVVTVGSEGGQFTARLTQNYLGTDLSTEFQAVQRRADGIVLPGAADTGTGYSEILIRRPSFTELFVLDLPLLRDEDANAGTGSRYYFAMDGYGDDWRGAGFFVSDTGERYEQRGAVFAEVGWGVAMTALGEASAPWQTDTINSVTVRFMSGAARLETISAASLLNGGNALLVGDEIINFAAVTANADGSHTLGTLLRGRRGTEQSISGHKAGERVILLEPDRLSRAVLSLAFLNLPHHWKAVGAGQLIEQAPAQIKALTGRDLKPYAPVHLNAVRLLDAVQVSWVRRSRVSGRGLSASAPLGEVSERYELCFELDGTRVQKYVRDEREYVYQLAEFNEDFDVDLDEIPSLNLKIYQLSDALGRGYPAEENI